MGIFEIPISKIPIFNWDDTLNGKSDRCPMLSSPRSEIPIVESKSKRWKKHAIASMDADIESSNGRIIEVSSLNIDAYIFVVL